MAEENTLTLQQVICPSCKRPINTFNPNKLMAECPYCHSKLVNPLVKPTEVPVPERIIPFTTNEGTFEKALINALVNQDYVPTNIFQAISTGDVIQAYLPMYLFEGTYNASWSCESSFQDQKVKVRANNSVTTKEVKNWRPQNGTAAGNFSFLCLANEGDEIPEELRKFSRLFPYDVMMSKVFDPDMINYEDSNLMTLERNTDKTLIWQKYGKDMVEDTARRTALEQLGGQEIRNFRASTSHTVTTEGRYVLAPFWFVYYNYNGGRYYFLMDGIGERNSYSYPISQEDINFVKGKERTNTIVKWLWPLAILLFFLDTTTGIVAGIIWLIAMLIFNFITKKQVNEHLEKQRELRKESANRIS